ncbi:C40 family peptidase [Vallitalea okinawensis]|uniref:C40 family peptidase n=1 Tax=Vallitalea okinawensis TaxID=2078660 RepID=UPI000CFD77F9|nr:SH3 domain-containing protein [Vallitalea okinawensis]
MSFRKKYVKTLCCIAGTLIYTMNAHAAVVGTVNVDQINVRTAPVQNSSNIISQLETDSQVHILDVDGDYYEIEYNDEIAYVFQDYVTFNGIPALVQADVNLRSEPEQKTENIMETIPGAEEIKVLSVGEEYSYVLYKEQYGYVYNTKLSFNEEDLQDLSYISEMKNAVVIADNLNVRQGANTSSSIITKLQRGNEVDVISIEGEWIKVKLTDEAIGYVHKAYVTLENAIQLNAFEEELSLGDEIANQGMQYVGVPYVYGGTSLTYGVDCSGFTQSIYQQFGVSISRTSRTQFNDGVPVSVGELQSGDLLFYGYNGYISHVAIYIGNGQIVHSSTPSTGVIISDMYASGKPYIGARRILY